VVLPGRDVLTRHARPAHGTHPHREIVRVLCDELINGRDLQLPKRRAVARADSRNERDVAAKPFDPRDLRPRAAYKTRAVSRPCAVQSRVPHECDERFRFLEIASSEFDTHEVAGAAVDPRLKPSIGRNVDFAFAAQKQPVKGEFDSVEVRRRCVRLDLDWR